MPTLIDRIRAAIAGTAREFWPQVVATQARAGEWDAIEALTALRELQEPPAAPPQPQTTFRLPPRTRLDRWDERPETPSGRFVRAMSLDPVLDWSISDGAARCLVVVMSLAGGTGRALVTLTSSIAKQIGRTARSVQNYYRELVDSGWLEHSFNRKTGLVTLTVTKAAEPPPMPEKPKAWPRLPSPKAGWGRVSRGGAKLAAHIKAKVCKSALLEDAVAAAEVHFSDHPTLPSDLGLASA
jgi:hypothetical protein